ncbi:MAG TPA: prepilin-type N-terminal cleavage/methylation domain-containing protein [Mariprofundaceae bacterium]|nr:prepilin-type N-terminal cleavage/methylation domain-containing protein [Mariprofundaceae bacterium]
MTERQSIVPKPSTRSYTSGFTLLEMMVALLVTSIIVAAALSLTMSVRNLYRTDQPRIALNQNLRGGMEVLSADIRQAGERLPTDPLVPVNIMPIEIQNGASGASDTIYLRRNMVDAVLPVCKDIKANSNTDVAKVAIVSANPPAGCGPVPDNNGDGWPDNLEAWRKYRTNNGANPTGAVRVYIFDPVTGLGEWITYDAEDSSTFQIHKSSGKWKNSYPASHKPRLYAMEERKYYLAGDRLRLQVNGGGYDDVTASLTDFQAQAIMQNGTVLNAFGNGNNWLKLKAVKVTLSGLVKNSSAQHKGSLTMQLFPRNILSN